MKTIDHTNRTRSRLSITLSGASGAGKTHGLLTFPKPIRILHPDPNHQTADALAADFARQGLEVTLDVPESWDDMLTWVKDAKARKFNAQTLGVDTYSIGSMFSEDRFNGAPDQQQWGRVRSEHLQFFRDITSVTSPLRDLPTYHVVVNVHLLEVKERLRQVDAKGRTVVVEGKTIGYRPAIAGSAKDLFNRMFGCVFVLERRTQIRTSSDAEGHVTVDAKSLDEWVCWTAPPNALYECKDGVGGKGAYKRLPPRMVINNLYHDLCQAWGMTPDPDLKTLDVSDTTTKTKETNQ